MLAPLFAARLGCEREFARAWFLAPEQIRDMSAGGMEFACHAHRHEPLRGEPHQYVSEEVDPCAAWLARILARRPDQYVAAFGGTNSCGRPIRDAEPELRARGFRRAYLTETGLNRPLGYFVQRIDAARLPPRTAGLMVTGPASRSGDPDRPGASSTP